MYSSFSEEDNTAPLISRKPTKRRDCNACALFSLTISALIFVFGSTGLAIGATIWRNEVVLFLALPSIVVVDFIALAIIVVTFLANAPEKKTKYNAIAALVFALIGFIDTASLVPVAFHWLSDIRLPGIFSWTGSDKPSKPELYLTVGAWICLLLSSIIQMALASAEVHANLRLERELQSAARYMFRSLQGAPSEPLLGGSWPPPSAGTAADTEAGGLDLLPAATEASSSYVPPDTYRSSRSQLQQQQSRSRAQQPRQPPPAASAAAVAAYEDVEEEGEGEEPMAWSFPAPAATRPPPATLWSYEQQGPGMRGGGAGRAAGEGLQQPQQQAQPQLTGGVQSSSSSGGRGGGSAAALVDAAAAVPPSATPLASSATAPTLTPASSASSLRSRVRAAAAAASDASSGGSSSGGGVPASLNPFDPAPVSHSADPTGNPQAGDDQQQLQLALTITDGGAEAAPAAAAATTSAVPPPADPAHADAAQQLQLCRVPEDVLYL